MDNLSILAVFSGSVAKSIRFLKIAAGILSRILPEIPPTIFSGIYPEMFEKCSLQESLQVFHRETRKGFLQEFPYGFEQGFLHFFTTSIKNSSRGLYKKFARVSMVCQIPQ